MLLSLSRHLRQLVTLTFFIFTLSTGNAFASALSNDLAALVSQGQAVDAQVAGITLTPQNSCTELKLASTSVADWLAATETVYASMNTAFSVDASSLTSLDDLSNLAVSLAARIQGLSMDINSIDDVAELVEFDASLAAMLRLSDDIGTMAGRIGEMADRILVMADNIGAMADRILITQQLQSANVVTTQNSILATQQNMIALSDTVATLTYEPALIGLLTQANALGFSMDLVSLNTLNMAVELMRIEGEVSVYLAQVNTLYSLVMADSQVASHYINGDTLTLLADLSSVNRTLAAILDSYGSDIERLDRWTSSSILSSATASMLQLGADIGVMSDRIIEMSDRIVVMADNIGDMSNSIVETQNIQQTNIEFTQASLLAASNATIGVIAANEL